MDVGDVDGNGISDFAINRWQSENGTLYLVLNAASENYQELLEFADFANSPRGREVVRTNGVVPYLEAPALLLKQMEQWSTASNR